MPCAIFPNHYFFCLLAMNLDVHGHKIWTNLALHRGQRFQGFCHTRGEIIMLLLHWKNCHHALQGWVMLSRERRVSTYSRLAMAHARQFHKEELPPWLGTPGSVQRQGQRLKDAQLYRELP